MNTTFNLSQKSDPLQSDPVSFRPGQFPAAEAYYARAISIPLHPTLTDDQQDYVVAEVKIALQA